VLFLKYETGQLSLKKLTSGQNEPFKTWKNAMSDLKTPVSKGITPLHIPLARVGFP
jgi:hypothetical protein